MRKVTVDYPVVGWGSTVIEVEDHLTNEQVLDLIAHDEIDVPWNRDFIMSVFPVSDLTEYVRNGGDGEAPIEVMLG